MHITCDLLGLLLTVDWTTNVNITPSQTRKPPISPHLTSSGTVSKTCHKIWELGKKGRKNRNSLGGLQPLSAVLVSERNQLKRIPALQLDPCLGFISCLHLGSFLMFYSLCIHRSELALSKPNILNPSEINLSLYMCLAVNNSGTDEDN